MKADSPHWMVMGDPATPSEEVALEVFRELLPDDGVTTAWVNLTFISDSGRTAEVDVLLLTPSGMYVVELKGWHGKITGNPRRWQHGARNVENPRLLADRKAKWLKSLMQDQAPNSAAKAQVPWVDALVVMHGHRSRVLLNPPADIGVVTLDSYEVQSEPSLKPLTKFLQDAPASARRRIDIQRAEQIRALCNRIGFTAAPKVRMVGDFKVEDSAPIAQGPDWQDVLVALPSRPDTRRRLRLYDVPSDTSNADRLKIEQLARREFDLTQGMRQLGITTPIDYKTTDDGPALVFEYDAAEVPLNAYLAQDGADLSLSQRLDFTIRLGEILRSAHNSHLRHRALSPNRVWVTPTKDGPMISIRDWYFAQRESSTRNLSKLTSVSAGADDLLGLAESSDWIWFAPEARNPATDLPSIPLDVYGYGALAYYIVTGSAPAASFVDLEQRLSEAGALDPRAHPGIPDEVAEAIVSATRVNESERLATVDAFISALRQAADNLHTPVEPSEESSLDPVDATTGDSISDRFAVQGRRGEGSSGVALAVFDQQSHEPDRVLILKVARTEAAAKRLPQEADILRALDHRRIVRLIEGPIKVNDRSALLLSDAGADTLASRIAADGRMTVGQLEHFGYTLLDAMAYLEKHGIFHRDVKPANLAISPDPASKKPSLVLFDFSLAAEGLDKIASGTPSYLDPYLGGKRTKYDRAAELWAVSATLFEMATGQLPWWGEGASRPSNPADRPVISSSSFEPVVAIAMAALFQRALNPDSSKRFPTVDDLAAAWQEVFAPLDIHEEDAVANDELAEQAVLETPLERSGLSARALSALSRLQLATVGELLGIHPVTINGIRGLGETYRKEIQARIRRWRETLAETNEVEEQAGVERTVQSLLANLSGQDLVIARRLLGLEHGSNGAWASPADIGRSLDVSRAQIIHSIDLAVDTWAKSRILDAVVDEVARFLARSGRVAPTSSLISALIADRGSLLSGDERLQFGNALLRAAFEFDSRAEEPLLMLRRSTLDRHADLIALHQSADPDGTGAPFPPADNFVEVAVEIGRTADELVQQHGVTTFPTSYTAVRDLVHDAEIPQLLTLQPRALLALAASCSKHAALSRFDEFYPVTLDPIQAITIAWRGKPTRTFSSDAIRRSVSARFPMVTLPSPLGDLVMKAIPGAISNGDVYEVMSLAPSRPMSTGTLSQAFHDLEIPAKLRASLERKSALTLTTSPKRYQASINALHRAFGPIVIDVGEQIVRATREAAAMHGIAWDFILNADSQPVGSRDRQTLDGFVQAAFQPRWDEVVATPTPLLIVNAGPIARYSLVSSIAQMLDTGTPRPAARWLLIPKQGNQAVPLINREPVPIGTGGWLDLPADLEHLISNAVQPDQGATQ